MAGGSFLAVLIMKEIIKERSHDGSSLFMRLLLLIFFLRVIWYDEKVLDNEDYTEGEDVYEKVYYHGFGRDHDHQSDTCIRRERGFRCSL